MMKLFDRFQEPKLPMRIGKTMYSIKEPFRVKFDKDDWDKEMGYDHQQKIFMVQQRLLMSKKN